MKDVTNNTLTEINVDFTPAVIKIDREAVEAQVADAVAKYSNQEITAETYKEVYNERTIYNNLTKALETKRKEIKGVINLPYKDFETWYKDKVLAPISEVTEKMTEGLNAIDEHERLLRVDVVRATFEEKCELADLDKSTFETSYNDYSLKKYFKAGKFELKQSTIDEIDNLVLAEFKAVEEFKASKETVEEQAKEYDLLPEMYIRALEDGKTLVDILKVMKADKDAVILRKEQEEAKAEAERKAEIERLAQENANAQIKAYNAETGEVLESDVIIPETQNEAENGAKFENKPVVYDLRLIFPNGDKQAKMFKDFLDMNGIKYQQL